MATIVESTTSRNGNTPKITVSGGLAPNPEAFLEKGINAVPYFVENIPELRGRQRANKVYTQILKNDAQARTALRACTIPVLGGQWYMEPGGEAEVDNDAKMLVEDNLFGNTMTVLWIRTLENVTKCMAYGHSAFEKVYEVRPWRPNLPNRNTRNHYFLRKLLYLPQDTIVEFYYDSHGGPNGLSQRAADPSQPTRGKFIEVDIPIEKLLIIPFDQEGGNLEGNSLLRSAYKHVYYKENFYKIDGVQKERHGIGVPFGKPPPGYTEDDLKFAAELLGNIRANERSFFIEPPGWEFGFKDLPGNQVDALESAMHHDLMIARNVLVQFINMGQGSGAGASSGARATSGTMLDLFLKSLRHVGNLICDHFNTYLIPQLVNYNFEVDSYPQLKVRRIGETRDLQMFAAALRNLREFLTIDDETEKWLRTEIDMPAAFDNEVERGGSQPTGFMGAPPVGRQNKPVNAAE